MKLRTHLQRLILAKETLANLVPSELTRVRGGYDTDYTCYTCDTCNTCDPALHSCGPHQTCLPV